MNASDPISYVGCPQAGSHCFEQFRASLEVEQHERRTQALASAGYHAQRPPEPRPLAPHLVQTDTRERSGECVACYEETRVEESDVERHDAAKLHNTVDHRAGASSW